MTSPGGDGFLEARHVELGRQVAAFTAGPLAAAGIEEDLPQAGLAVLRLLADAGLLAHVVPAPWGGAADPVDLRAVCVIREGLARASGLADLMFTMQGLGSRALVLAGDDGLRRRLLPGVVDGSQVAAIAVTEPEAGSDLGRVALRARRTGEDYRLDGVKCFISNAGIATFYTALARTGPVEEGRDGLSFFVVEGSRAGLSVEPQEILAPHPLGTVRLDGCRVPAANRLGEEGEGFALAIRVLNFFRPTVGAAAVGFASRALEETLARVRARQQFGRPLAAFQGVQHQIADMAVAVDAARLLVHRAAATEDAGHRRPDLASMAKLYATEAAGRVVDAAVQLHGGSGLLRGAAVERLYREVRALRIYEGTSEIQRNVIGRELLRGRSPSA